MKNFLTIFALVFAFAFTASAQTFNDKSDFSVAYQYTRKDVKTEDLTKPSFDRTRDEHGANVGYTYYFTKSVGLGGELSANFGNETSTVTYLGTVTAKKRSGKANPFLIGTFGVTRERIASEQFRFPNSRDTDTGAAFGVGTGFDYKVGKNTSIRVLRVDYLQSRIYGQTGHNARFSTGIVF